MGTGLPLHPPPLIERQLCWFRGMRHHGLHPPRQRLSTTLLALALCLPAISPRSRALARLAAPAMRLPLGDARQFLYELVW